MIDNFCLMGKVLEFNEGPPSLGGPHEQHLSTSFKIYGDWTYEQWAPRAMKVLANMVDSFTESYRFWDLGDPLRDAIWVCHRTDKICVREYQTPVREAWTEPAEDFKGEFIPRMKWPDHTRVVFEVVFTFAN